PDPIIPKRLIEGVSERVDCFGKVVVELNEEETERAVRHLADLGVEAIAVCFLFSYIDPTHEERAKEIIEEEYPESFVTNSASVAPQFREFERFTTAAMNAFIGPKVRDYVANFEIGLKSAKLNAELHIMGSHGGAATAAMVNEKPVLTLLSGPAAGVLGGAWSANLCGRDRLITFDVGGTSADIGIVIDGRITEATARDTWIGGYPVLVPMIDIETIGAGGGSIASIDRGGAFRVGPESAGSKPGPAAYGYGGNLPTVTDANLIMGRLDKDHFLGGEMALDTDAARAAIDRLAIGLGLDAMETAAGILTILNSNMANAIRSRTVQKGLDPRDFALVAFGGAGPLHGAEVADMLDIPEVIVPAHPGITSAAGLLTTDLKYDAIKTEFQVEGSIDLEKLSADFAALEANLRGQYATDGIDDGHVLLTRAGDLRYVGQGYELRIEFPQGMVDEGALDDVWRAFHDRHEAEYGHVFPDSPIEIVNIRMTGTGTMPKIAAPVRPPGGSAEAATLRIGTCVFRVAGELKPFETIYYQRDKLGADSSIPGPAVIIQTDATTVIPPGWSASVETGDNMILRKER
ncbi:MAG: hydantoinase/oxoprolinase family protein, partial [Alphaproteobacteria bacterium]|nr:hydantoinase/oxoprolinase family protein [Alphaproteobacteria bacterium]